MWQCIIHWPELVNSTAMSAVKPAGIKAVSFQTWFATGRSLLGGNQDFGRCERQYFGRACFNLGFLNHVLFYCHP